MTDEERIAELEAWERRYANPEDGSPVDNVRWLLGEYRRQGAEIAELKRRLDEERLDKAKFLMGAEGIR